MDIDKMEMAFLETSYIIHLEKEVVLKIGEVPTQFLVDHSHIRTWAFITAWNPLPEILSKSENERRNNQLKDQLIKEGFICHPGIGVSKNEDWSEDSFFIENIDIERANDISSEYGQLAFLFGDSVNGNQLVFTKKII